MENYNALMDILKFTYHKILLNQIVLSFFSGFMGALIAGGFSWLATKQSHENNLKLEAKKNAEIEKAVILSIVEELKVFYEIYYLEMNNFFEQLKNEDDYLKSYYIVTQDFFTVYSNNADKIGIISNKELRNLIVKIYVYLKRFLEDFNLLRMYYEELHSNDIVTNEIKKTSWDLKNNFQELKKMYDLIINIVSSIYKE